jgi:hypothetical protein
MIVPRIMTDALRNTIMLAPPQTTFPLMPHTLQRHSGCGRYDLSGFQDLASTLYNVVS